MEKKYAVKAVNEDPYCGTSEKNYVNVYDVTDPTLKHVVRSFGPYRFNEVWAGIEKAKNYVREVLLGGEDDE